MKSISLLAFIAVVVGIMQSCQSSAPNNVSVTPDKDIQVIGQAPVVANPSSPTSNIQEAPVKVSEKVTKKETFYPAVAPPFKGVDVPFQKLSVNATSGGVLRLANGTKINVPANAFTNAAGQVVSGQVELQYREFHNAAELLASGIIMHDPKTGVYMQTAGMFQLVGKQGGETVNIAEGKTLNVDMASFVNDGTVFDKFYLQEKEAKWDNLGACPAKPNLEKEAAIKRVQERMAQNPKPIPVKKALSGNFVIGLDIDYSNFPELRPFSDVIWEYAGNKDDAGSPQKNPDMFKVDWLDVKLKKDNEAGVYRLNLSNANSTISVPVLPILKGQDYASASADFNKRMENYNKVLKEIEAQQVYFEKQADIVRSFEVEKWGIYNSDICLQPDRIKCSLVLNFQGTDIAYSQEMLIYYLITADNRSLIRYYYDDISSRFSFNPDQNSVFVSILPNSHLAVCNQNDFRNLNIERVASGYKANLTLTVLPNEIKDMNDIQAVLKTLM